MNPLAIVRAAACRHSSQMIARVPLVASALVAAAALPAQASTPAEVLAALPALEGMRLTTIQAQLLGRTQRTLHELNPSRIGETETLLTTHNLCFREVARSKVIAAYANVAATLSDGERSEVTAHLRQSGAAQLLALEEGSAMRVEATFDSPAMRSMELPGVIRFHKLVRGQVRRIALTAPGIPCQQAMRADFVARGMTFVFEPSS